MIRTLVILLGTLPLVTPSHIRGAEPPLKVGVLHSQTGTMAVSELPLIDAITMAVDEINRKGGVLGRRLETVVRDGASDWPTFAREAEKLILEDKVVTVFGCWTSASRQAVIPVLEAQNHLLWYPLQYEGNERSRHIVYTGAAPNQQITPAVEWCRHEFGSQMFLVGSDYVFPKKANEIIRLQLANYGVEPAGVAYRDLGDEDFDDIVAEIQRVKPDVILNTINGSSNAAFFAALRAAGIGPNEIPVMSFSIAENELQEIGLDLTSGHYCSWNYFQSIDTPANLRFVRGFKQRFGDDRVTDDPIEAAYFQVYLFAKAVERAKSTEIDDIRTAVRGLVFAAPEGLVRVDPRNLHTWKVSRIGRIRPDGQFKIVWSSKDPLRPRPFLPQAFLAAAQAHGQIMFEEISRMMDGLDGIAADKRLQVLRAMADVRGYQGETRTKFQQAVVSIQASNREAFEKSWQEFEKRWQILNGWMRSLDERQVTSFKLLSQAKLDFAANANEMFTALYADEMPAEVCP